MSAGRCGSVCVAWCVKMLRLSIISSVIPLALAGGFAQDWTSTSTRQCFAADAVASAPGRVAFTDDPARATVRVQLVDGAELADLVIAEDNSATEPENCGLRGLVRSITISARPVAGEPVIYLSREARADYRVYVDSAQISAQQAAALIVGARGGHMRLAAHAFDNEPTGSIGR
jgi:hypothetical protein